MGWDETSDTHGVTNYAIMSTSCEKSRFQEVTEKRIIVGKCFWCLPSDFLIPNEYEVKQEVISIHDNGFGETLSVDWL